MVLYHIQRQRTRSTQQGTLSTTKGTPSFGPVERHPFAQLYTWAACRDLCTKLGMSSEEHILQLHWMHMHRTFLFQCIPGQCTLTLIPLQHVRRAGSTPWDSPNTPNSHRVSD